MIREVLVICNAGKHLTKHVRLFPLGGFMESCQMVVLMPRGCWQITVRIMAPSSFVRVPPSLEITLSPLCEWVCGRVGVGLCDEGMGMWG